MKKLLKSSWTIGIATTLLGFLLTVGYDLIKEKQVFTTIGMIFSTLWSWIIAFMTFDLKVWWVLLGIATIFAALFVMAKISEQKEKTQPDFTSYTRDHFRTWKWSWEWAFSKYEQKWHVSKLKAHCPKCDTPMLSDRDGDVFQCPRCRFYASYDEHEKPYEVEAIIIDNLKRKIDVGGAQK